MAIHNHQSGEIPGVGGNYQFRPVEGMKGQPWFAVALIKGVSDHQRPVR